jgi:CO/xanthine dehydrogenase Mo-binding subunit
MAHGVCAVFCGFSPAASNVSVVLCETGDLDLFIMLSDSVYNFPTYLVQGTVCKTNLAATTSMRAPGATQSIFMLESCMDQVATAIGMDPMAFRQANFLQLVRVSPPHV